MNVEHALLKSDTDYILSLSLVVPCYIVFFIGNEPYIQGLAYICYPLSLILLFFVKKNIVVTRNFLFYWLLFVSAWIIPSIRPSKIRCFICKCFLSQCNNFFDFTMALLQQRLWYQKLVTKYMAPSYSHCINHCIQIYLFKNLNLWTTISFWKWSGSSIGNYFYIFNGIFLFKK